jgi:hypothetical protein
LRIPEQIEESVAITCTKQVVDPLGDLRDGVAIEKGGGLFADARQMLNRATRLNLDVLFELPIPQVVDVVFGGVIVIEDEHDELFVGCPAQINAQAAACS